MKFCILTLGCKVNSYESEFIKEQFEKKNYVNVGLNDRPDVVVINTCSVTNQSDAKSRHIVRLARRSAPDAIIAACGCSAQNHMSEFLEVGADIVIGNKDKSRILDLINAYCEDKKKISRFYDMTDLPFEPMYLRSESDKTRGFVKIQDGCDNFCSYCIIPYLRGNIRSKNIDEACKEIDDLVASGHREIVLTGIHTGSYGRGENFDLVDLIRRISLNPNLLRIRISSIEITELNDKFMDELKNNSKICNHLHIPLQSGSDVVLKKMNRKYDTEYFENKIKAIRTIRPDISITTDLIVGFPYETDREFESTYNFIKKIGFTKVHTFPFSLRNGTEAENMKEAFVQDSIKKERVKKVLELSQYLENMYYEKFIGQNLEVIVETSKNGISEGHTDNYILVKLDKCVDSGQIVDVSICEVDGTSVKGKVLSIV